MLIFGTSAAAILVELECPHCGTVQVRARRPHPAFYVCRQCRRHFEPPDPQEQRPARGGRTARKR